MKIAEQNEIRKIFPDYQPFRRHKTVEEREDEVSMKRWYRRLVDEGDLPGKPPKRCLRRDNRGMKQGVAIGRASVIDADRNADQSESALSRLMAIQVRRNSQRPSLTGGCQ